ncbi:MAG: hypothetical protein V7K67_31200 [Nostoc sp.]|uniref:hypothetical protein n=1 Tax=Nostoc sp. TaxID=1180 RepID=UPI002FF9EAFA
MKILFCDIDGTLTETISGHTFKQSPTDVKIIVGADKAIAHFADLGWLIVGVSNQGGCDTINRDTGKPLKSFEDAIAEMQFTLKLFPRLKAIQNTNGNYSSSPSKECPANLSNTSR